MNERDQERLIGLIAGIAERWRNPDYEAREEAVRETLSDETSYTEESLAFVINQALHQLTAMNLTEWLKGRRTAAPAQVGILNRGASFFLEIQDFLAVLLTGHHYRGVANPESPYLLQAFADEVRALSGYGAVVFVTQAELFESSDAVIASLDEENEAQVIEACDERGIPHEKRLLRRPTRAIAVLDGRETEQDLENLAEDMLLHDGRDRRNVALIWAPRGMAPDTLLDAMAAFRGVFPAHPGLPGTLKMQQAFLDAVKVPNAYGEGMEFLLSKGEPEVQRPGHVRWTEYDSLDTVSMWLRENREQVELVVGRSSTTSRIDRGIPVSNFGEAQRPSLAWQPGGVDTIAFLTGY